MTELIKDPITTVIHDYFVFFLICEFNCFLVFVIFPLSMEAAKTFWCMIVGDKK